MDPNQFLNNLNLSFFLNLGLKPFGILAALIYLCVAIVLIEQVKVMKRTIEVQDRGLLSLVAFIQLISAIILLFYGLFIL